MADINGSWTTVTTSPMGDQAATFVVRSSAYGRRPVQR